MDQFVNARGQGSLGTATNSPINDGGTMARTQNRAAVPYGTLADANYPGRTRLNLTEQDRAFIREIHRARHLDGSPCGIDDLLSLRAQTVELQRQALREFGPGSSTVLWFKIVIQAYDETIAEVRSPMGSAINGLRKVLADKASTEKDRREKVSTAVQLLHEKAILGQDDDAKALEAMGLIVDIIKVNAQEKRDELDGLVKMEKRSPGSVSDDKFRNLVEGTIGAAREEAMLTDNEDGSSQTMSLVADALNVVADRRVASLKNLIEKETRSPGSVPDQQFVKLVEAVIGDERQKEMLGISKSEGSGMELVVGVMKIFIAKRKAAIESLFKKQRAPGTGVTNQQINQALADYETIKAQARLWGIAVPNAPDIPDQDFKAQYKPSQP